MYEQYGHLEGVSVMELGEGIGNSKQHRNLDIMYTFTYLYIFVSIFCIFVFCLIIFVRKKMGNPDDD